MSYITLELENEDVKFNNDSQFVLTDEQKGLEQNYQVWLETQYASDYRDDEYGFKLEELIATDYDDKVSLLELFIKESLSSHPRTERVEEVIIEKIEDRRYKATIKVVLNNTEDVIIVEGSFDVTE